MSTASYLFHVTCLLLLTSLSAKAPNILFIVADDYGWNDVGFRNPDVITPNIDKLAHSGMILQSSYVMPVCTPDGVTSRQAVRSAEILLVRFAETNMRRIVVEDMCQARNLCLQYIKSRNSFMTGHYAYKSGLQHIVIFPEQATCSPLNYAFLPQKLKELGYTTHAIGKWHLGFCKWECTPTYRGFDTFYGYYNGMEDYYQLSVAGGKDFRDNKTPVNATGEYSAHMYARRAQSIIMDHDMTKPMFMYLPFQSVHNPLQVPDHYSAMYPNVKTESRKTYLGMVTAMDEAIGNITNALKTKGMFNDTLIIFTSDNGGWVTYAGNNYPLRGGKTTLFEGGTRATAFISGAGIQKTNSVYNGIIHAVDWMPTVLSAAGGIPDPSLDGIDQWDSLRTGGESKRTEFVYNIDDMKPENCGHAAIRMGDYKLIDGYPGYYQGWYKPDQVVKENHEEAPANVTFPFADTMMLFNLKDDPNEHVDLSKKLPDVVSKLKSRLDSYHKQIVPADFPPSSKSAAPQNYGGFWTPGWC